MSTTSSSFSGIGSGDWVYERIESLTASSSDARPASAMIDALLSDKNDTEHNDDVLTELVVEVSTSAI
jgi:hypothetical protein